METLLNPQAEALIAYRTFWQASEEGLGEVLGGRGGYGSGFGSGCVRLRRTPQIVREVQKTPLANPGQGRCVRLKRLTRSNEVSGLISTATVGLLRLALVILSTAILRTQESIAGPKASNYCHSIQSAAANGYSVNPSESCEDLETGKYYKSFKAFCVAMKKSGDPRKVTGC